MINFIISENKLKKYYKKINTTKNHHQLPLFRMKLRNHSHACTGCERSFASFKQLRKHWDGQCPMSQTASPASPEPASPEPTLIGSPSLESETEIITTTKRINPTLNFWLNDNECDAYIDEADYNHVDGNENNNDDDDYENSKPLEAPIPVNALEHIINAKRDELLLTLLDVVEKLSSKVFSEQTVHPHTVGPSHVSTTSKTHEWKTVPGMKRMGTSSTETRKQIEISNPFDPLRINTDVVRQKQPSQLNHQVDPVPTSNRS